MPSAKPRKAAVSKSSKRAPAPRPAIEPEVKDFLEDLNHPRARDIEAVRKMILAVSPTIREGIKWNAPSFRTGDWFATFFLRAHSRVQLVFHMGAKKDETKAMPKIPDPMGLMEWLAKDRCMVTLGQGKEIQQHRQALSAIVRAWIRQLA